MSHFFVQVLVATVCAWIANILVPRRVPGKLLGLILIGLAGVWVGEWSYTLLYRQFGLVSPILSWQIEGVEIVPAILGSTIILFLLTSLIGRQQYRS